MYLLISLTTPAPGRRRVWQQATALAERGHRVRVLSPRRPGQAAFERIEGVEVERFVVPIEGRGRLGLVLENAALLVQLSRALFRLAVLRRVTAIQLANPPDWSLPVAILLRRPRTPIVFDIADMTPALYEAKFQSRGALYHLISALFHLAIRRADLLLTPNDLYRRYAMAIGNRPAVSTIRVASYPPAAARPPSERRPGPLRIGYFGVLGTHDGVDRLLAALALLRAGSGLPSFRLEIVGDGPAMTDLVRFTAENGLTDVVSFHGFLQQSALEEVLRGFDLAVIPDPMSRYAHGISMNKVFVYAARELAVVSTPLRQTRRLLGDAAIYAEDDTPVALAGAIEIALRNEKLREGLGKRLGKRSAGQFLWAEESARYVTAVEMLGGLTPA